MRLYAYAYDSGTQTYMIIFHDVDDYIDEWLVFEKGLANKSNVIDIVNGLNKLSGARG